MNYGLYCHTATKHQIFFAPAQLTKPGNRYFRRKGKIKSIMLINFLILRLFYYEKVLSSKRTNWKEIIYGLLPLATMTSILHNSTSVGSEHLLTSSKVGTFNQYENYFLSYEEITSWCTLNNLLNGNFTMFHQEIEIFLIK